MRTLVFVVALGVASKAYAADCAVRERDLVGAWVPAGAAAIFQEMAFEISGSRREFNSWLHERPEIVDAEWSLKACKLTVRESSGSSQTFTVSRKGGRLVLVSSDGTSASYRRVKLK